jgi:hypothetical protein
MAPANLLSPLRQSKVREFDIAILKDQQILQLQIPIDDSIAVQHLQSFQYASSDKPHCSFAQQFESAGADILLLRLRSEGKQVSECRVFHYNVF